jgi:hypothetical protein
VHEHVKTNFAFRAAARLRSRRSAGFLQSHSRAESALRRDGTSVAGVAGTLCVCWRARPAALSVTIVGSGTPRKHAVAEQQSRRSNKRSRDWLPRGRVCRHATASALLKRAATE